MDNEIDWTERQSEGSDKKQMLLENFIDVEHILDYIEDVHTDDEDRENWFDIIRLKIKLLKDETTKE